jgi:tetraacyldisaccharide 4'-kinase
MNLQVAAGRAVLALGRTWRVEWHGMQRLDAARRRSPSGNIIYALWHGSLAMLTYTHRDRDVQVLVSPHRDGEIVARILASMGYGLVRGSTHRGAVEALFGLAKHLEHGRDVAITVDGPMGPRYAVHPGVLLLARRTGRPIVPIIATARNGTFLSSWDAQRLPYPLSRVRIQHGEPIWLGRDRGALTLRQGREELASSLRRWTRDEEMVHGRRVDLRDVQDRRSYWERISERDDPPLGLRALAAVHGAARHLERRLRPRPPGRARRQWVVGVGNLEAGGTGKTPCVITLVRALAERNVRVGVLTRGHRGRLGRQHPVILTPENEAQASDETRLLADALLPESVVVVARNKRRGLELLEARQDLEVVVVDDAFQTAGLPVDRHLVLLDWERPLGNGHLLPAGRLREPAVALRRAHALLFTRARGDAMPRHPAWSHLEPERCFLARERMLGMRSPSGERIDPERLRGQGIALLSGVGRPRAFETGAQEIVASYGAEVRRIVRLGDHAPIDAAVRWLTGKLHGIGCRFLVLTHKDLKRLPVPPTNDEPLLVLEQRIEVDAVVELLQILVPRSTGLRSSRSSPTAMPERGSPRPT